MFAFAQDETPLATGEVIAAADEASAKPAAMLNGSNSDDIAVNQGVVAYWYAHGFANAFGSLPAKWADLEAASSRCASLKARTPASRSTSMMELSTLTAT